MVLNFSYSAGNKLLLNNIEIINSKGSVLLICGNINKNLLILSGILCKLIPAEDKLDIEHLEELFHDYYGKLLIKQGELSEYYLIGDQPDRHFIFSFVYEEFYGRTQIKNEDKILELLNRVGLNEHFYFRKINTLSGGEKIKLSLALALSSDCDNYLFYNTVPWLDDSGRNTLLNIIKEFKSKGKRIIIFEQEYDFLIPLVDKFANFKSNTLAYENNLPKHKPTILTLARLFNNKNNQSFNKEIILSFQDVLFTTYQNDNPNQKKNLTQYYPLLNNISFNIYKREHFILSGENGSGKSTIFNLCFRMITPEKGKILFLNNDISNYNRKELCHQITYISQFPQYQMIYHHLSDYLSSIKDDYLKEELMSIMPQEDNTSVMQMSLFEMKVILLLSSLSSGTRLLMLDEPSWGLDGKQILTFLNLLYKLLQRYEFTIFAITHSQEFIKNISFKTLKLHRGNLIIND